MASELILAAQVFPPIALAPLHTARGLHTAPALPISTSQAGPTMGKNNSMPILQGPPP